jgi:AI-2 transport protein TqsA
MAFMSDETTKAPMLRYLAAAAAVVIIVAGMRAASQILVPLLLAVFVAAVLTPVIQWMQRHRVPTPVALVIVMAVIAGVMLGVGLMVGTSLHDFTQDLEGDELQVRLKTQLQAMLDYVRTWGIEVPPNAGDLMNVEMDTRTVTSVARTMAGEIGSLLSKTVLILIAVIFMLSEAALFPAKLRSVLSDPQDSMGHLSEILENIRRYMAIKTLTSLLTGVLVALLLWFLGVRYPILWGMVAFLFNYVPNIGSILAAIPAVLLALITQDAATAVWVTIGYLAINMTISYAIEPRYMGQGLGLSTLVVFLSLIFWGWVLGPVGMLLSAPLTMVAKIALGTFDESKWIAVLLGTREKT